MLGRGGRLRASNEHVNKQNMTSSMTRSELEGDESSEETSTSSLVQRNADVIASELPKDDVTDAKRDDSIDVAGSDESSSSLYASLAPAQKHDDVATNEHEEFTDSLASGEKNVESGGKKIVDSQASFDDSLKSENNNKSTWHSVREGANQIEAESSDDVMCKQTVDTHLQNGDSLQEPPASSNSEDTEQKDDVSLTNG